MRQGFSIYDTHTHIGVARHSGARYSADDLLRDMDAFGVDRSLVIPFPVVEDRRAAHDEIGRAVLAHPDRLTGASCMDPYVPEAEFRAEVRRCRERYGFRAMKLQPQYQGLNPMARNSEFWFDTARENGMAAVCHTGTGIPFSLPSSFMLPARDFPDVPIVLAHCGGGTILVGEAITAALFCPNIYLELSSLMPYHVLQVLARVPASRLMIGSDLPENLRIEMTKIIDLDVPEADRAEILAGTGNRVFGG